VPKDSDVADPRSRSIAVFGSSEPAEGDPGYARARRLGELLARAGFRVVTGGYGGVMEAASRGAVEAGGTTVGVTSAVFRDRRPNPFSSRVVESADLHDRTRELIRLSDGFVVLPGQAGTLAEVAWLWALHRAGCLGRRPVVLVGDGWRELLRHLVRAGILDASQFDVTRVVDTPEEALDALERH
jgi:uncharacterized protein (TIGR00730 family)